MVSLPSNEMAWKPRTRETRSILWREMTLGEMDENSYTYPRQCQADRDLFRGVLRRLCGVQGRELSFLVGWEMATLVPGALFPEHDMYIAD